MPLRLLLHGVACLLLVPGLGVLARLGLAQDTEMPTGLRFAGIPILNSNEGFGYGARASLYNHADGRNNPYLYTLEAQLFFTRQLGGGTRSAPTGS